MKSFQIKSFFVSCLALLFGFTLFGQELDLPQKSPSASISYTIGLTAITVEYASPSVKDRAIYGALVPYGEVWRAGANQATTVEFSTDVAIEGKALTKGKYALFLIPKEGDKWTAIFNKVHDQWGAYNYDENEDALRVEVSAKTVGKSEEHLAYSIVQQKFNKGYIRFAWEKKRAYIRVAVKVLDQAKKNIAAALEATEDDKKWQVYAQSADFLADHESELDLALEYADKSTELFTHSWNLWVRANVEAKKGLYKDAIASGEKSLEVGKEKGEDFYKAAKDQVAAKIEEWKANL